MKTENRKPLTLLEACTLMARETVSLLDGTADTLDSAAEFRDALAFLNSVQDLGDSGALLAWVEAELENSKKFAETGERTPELVKLDTPYPMPDPSMQLDAVWAILRAAAQEPLATEQWETMLNATKMLTEMDGLEDMILTTNVPAAGFLTTDELQGVLKKVRAVFQHQAPEIAGMEGTL